MATGTAVTAALGAPAQRSTARIRDTWAGPLGAHERYLGASRKQADTARAVIPRARPGGEGTPRRDHARPQLAVRLTHSIRPEEGHR